MTDDAMHAEHSSHYQRKKRQLAAQMRQAGGQPVGLAKSASNLFRDRRADDKHLLDVRDFNQVLAVDASAGWIEAEGMTPYEDLVDAALAHGVMPTVVPELKSITIGGAAAGVGVESSSFKYGLMHETLLEMDVLLADGSVVTCTPDNEYADLFFGIPNSYGTLGYALRLKVRAIPVKPYVQLSHRRFDDQKAFFDVLAAACAPDAGTDFVDGTAFEADRLTLTSARFVEQAPYTSDYGYKEIYYRSVAQRKEDFLTTRDYIWRWDTDWFWCSKNLYAQNPIVRRILGRKRLNSVTYTKIMRFNSKFGLTRKLSRIAGVKSSEAVIQDVDIPVEHAPEFLGFLFREIGIKPVWICPIRRYDPARDFPLYPMQPDRLYVNFGFWDRVYSRIVRPPGYFNRLVEHKVSELGGIKSLYSDSYYDPESFWSIYDRQAYQRLKHKYDPGGRFKDLYDKCVLRG